MNGFQAVRHMPGVWHISDAMGVCMTLLAGEKQALLVDTGYGLQDVQAFVRTLTDLPVRVLLTHVHHDHMLGARWFPETFALAADVPYFETYASSAQRSRVADQARGKGLEVPEDFWTAPIPAPRPMAPCALDLGGMTAQIMACPGHTPGSAVVYVPERGLLLTGDDWNPCTWLFFDEALGVQTLRGNLQHLLELPFEHVLCSHQMHLHPRAALEAFVSGLTDEAIRQAKPADMGRACDTRELIPAPGQCLIFDRGKAALKE